MKNRHARRGFSLFEVMLTAGVIVILTALTFPSLKSMYGYYKINGAVDSVRSAWAMARSRAIEEGRPYRFSVENEGSHYRIAPDMGDYWGGGAPSEDPAGQAMIVEQKLPPGVRFAVNGEPTMNMLAASNDEIAKQDEATGISADSYATAVVFLPDGTARENVRILFQVRGARAVQVELRGLTGTVSTQTLQP
jgi:Tfp pilus assembly protein FimT